MGGWVGDSQSQFALDSNSQHGELDTMLDEGQVEDASVRALRPRSSRRGSWESEASGWSARVAMVRERSLKASSWKTGPQTDGDGSELAGEEAEEVKGVHGPSPLAANGFTTDSLVAAAEDEGLTPPAKDIPENKFLTVSAKSRVKEEEPCAVQISGSETEQTPTKKPMEKSSDAEDFEEDLTQKTSLKEQVSKSPQSIKGVEVANG